MEGNVGYARRGTRTLKSVQTADFKSAMFTNFIILANRLYLTISPDFSYIQETKCTTEFTKLNLNTLT